jgi:hypothetical protein
MKKYEFPPMLGPCEEVQHGTAEWVLRLGARIRYQFESIDRNGVSPVLRSLRMALEASPAPWTVWPANEPCKTVDGFVELTCGVEFDQIRALVEGYLQDHELGRMLQTAKAKTDGERITERMRSDLHDGVIQSKPDQGNSSTYLLRRLSRTSPETLAAYERGEFPSVRAAARAAGVVKDHSPVDKWKAAWGRLSDADKVEAAEWLQTEHGEKPDKNNVSISPVIGEPAAKNETYELFKLAHDVDHNAKLFADTLVVFIRDRTWETGWMDELHGKMTAPTLTKFITASLPDGMGSSVPFIYGVLTGPVQHYDGARMALDLLEQQLAVEMQIPAKAQFEREMTRSAVTDPRTTIPAIDYTGLHDEPGSKGWIVAHRSMMLSCLSDIKNNQETGKTIYSQIEEHGGWRHLANLKGKPFRSFDEFCENPNGLGMPRPQLEERLQHQGKQTTDRLAAEFSNQVQQEVSRHIDEYLMPHYKEKLERADLLSKVGKPFTHDQWRKILRGAFPECINAEWRTEQWNLLKEKEVLMRPEEKDKPFTSGLPTSLADLLARKKTNKRHAKAAPPKPRVSDVRALK